MKTQCITFAILNLLLLALNLYFASKGYAVNGIVAVLNAVAAWWLFRKVRRD